MFFGLIGLLFLTSLFSLAEPDFVLAEEDVLGILNDNASPELKEIESKGLVPCTIETCTFCSLLKLLERINIFLLGIAFAVALFFVVLSGFIYIASIGDSGTMGFAKEGIKYAVGGFLICLFSFLAIHVVYKITGYKNPSGGNWWEIECSVESPQSSIDSTNKKKISKAYANEVEFDSFGGRKNPINLDKLIQESLSSLPENKYFFIHGLGGQSLNETAQQLWELTEKAKSAGKNLTVALPREDLAGNIVGQKTVSLNDFLDSLSDPITKNSGPGAEGVPGDPTKLKEKFSELALSLLDENSSIELPVVVTDANKAAPKFNENWVGLDWTGVASDGFVPEFEPNRTVVDGLNFEEGNGPFFYDPERYDGRIPEDQTHIQINLEPDGSLKTDDPISVLNVAPGVSKETLNNYLSEMIGVLETTQKKYSELGKEKDFIYGLTDLMTRSMSEKANRPSDPKDQKQYITRQDSENQGANTENGNRNDNLAGDGGLIQNVDNYIDRTGGTGILPDKIAQDNNQKDKLTDKQIEDLVKKILKQNQAGDNGNSNETGKTNNNGGKTNTGNNSSSTNGNNWSNTSVSSSGYKLNEEEKKRLEKMIEEYKKELNLNVPKEFVMCVIQRESAFKPEALNDRGEYSIGLMQINKRSKTDQAALSGLKKYGPNLYEKLKKHHGSDAKILDTASMQSKNDPQGEKGMTNIALGMAYLKKINAENRRGGALSGADDWDNLAAGYNCGPAGCRGGRTDYSTAVTACTRTMMAKNKQSESKSAGQ